MRTKFYVVIKSGSPEVIDYPLDFKQASQLAKARAKSNPGNTYVVMESTIGYVTQEVTEVSFTEDDELPF